MATNKVSLPYHWINRNSSSITTGWLPDWHFIWISYFPQFSLSPHNHQDIGSMFLGPRTWGEDTSDIINQSTYKPFKPQQEWKQNCWPGPDHHLCVLFSTTLLPLPLSSWEPRKIPSFRPCQSIYFLLYRFLWERNDGIISSYICLHSELNFVH